MKPSMFDRRSVVVDSLFQVCYDLFGNFSMPRQVETDDLRIIVFMIITSLMLCSPFKNLCCALIFKDKDKKKKNFWLWH